MENEKNDKQVDRASVMAALQQQIAARSGGIANLAAAFVAAKEEISNPTKNASNPHFGSNYATLDAVLGCFTEAFTKNGLALIQAPGELTDGNVSLVGLLVHKSGESIQFRTQLPLGPKATAQAAGSVITYARRYQAAAIAGVSQVDDDGNAGSSDEKQRRGKKAEEPASDNSALLDAIANAEDMATLEGLKEQVKQLGDKAIADAYVARRKVLKTPVSV